VEIGTAYGGNGKLANLVPHLQVHSSPFAHSSPVSGILLSAQRATNICPRNIPIPSKMVVNGQLVVSSITVGLTDWTDITEIQHLFGDENASHD